VFNLDVFLWVTKFFVSRVDTKIIRKVVSFQKSLVILLKYQVSPALGGNKTCNQVLAIIPIGTSVSKSMA